MACFAIWSTFSFPGTALYARYYGILMVTFKLIFLRAAIIVFDAF